MTTAPGALVLVATPIGNLGDLAPRAVRELEVADVVACEDTRRTGRLLQHAGVRARKLMTVNDHTEAAAVADVLRRLEAGQRVAVVTDAGMPGISDPGERLVRAAAAAGHEVLVVPGPSAAIAALVASGLPTGRFVFEGFLPRKGSARTERVRSLATETRTVVLYEAPHRIARTLADLAAAFGGDRRVAVARELTKLHEEVWRGTLDSAVEWAGTDPEREVARRAFTRDVANRVKEITGRDYIDPARTVDHVLLFIPNEAVHTFIHESDPTLLDKALAQRVVMCSPSTLFAVLAVVRQSTRNFLFERTSTEILECLTRFTKQWDKFAEQVDKVGRHVGSLSSAFDELSGTRRRQLEKELDRIEVLQSQHEASAPVGGSDEWPPVRALKAG